MVLPLQRHPRLRLPENRPRLVLRGLLGHQERREVHEIRTGTNRNQRGRIILRDFLTARGGSHPDRSLQRHRHDHREQTGRFIGVSVRNESHAHRRLFLKLRLHVAVQEPDLETDHVRTQRAGRLPQDGTRNMLVRRR